MRISNVSELPSWRGACRGICVYKGATPAGDGRPEKLQDVCYSWWCLSALRILDRLHWIDAARLRDFILDCQDEENGGISDRPEDEVDIYHTFFGLAGLALIGDPLLESIDPTVALPTKVVVDRLKDSTLRGRMAL